MLRGIYFFVLSYFFTFFGCASIDKNNNYLPTPAVMRPYTLPDNYSSWTVRVPFGFRESTLESVLLKPLPWFLEWEFAISDSFSLTSRPLPTGIKWGYFNSSFFKGGLATGSQVTFSMDSQFRIQPYLEHKARFILSSDFAIDSSFLMEFDLAMQAPPREASKGLLLKEFYFLNQSSNTTLISPGFWIFASQGRLPFTKYFLESTQLSAQTRLGWGVGLKTQNRISDFWELETLMSYSVMGATNPASLFYNELTLRHIWQ